MIKYYYDLPQNSPEWFEARMGVFTSSNMKHILTPTLKVANNDKTRSYVYEIAAQRITGHVEEVSCKAFDRGHFDEPIARDLYSETYRPMKECGFITNDKLGFMIGMSPDGLIDEDGLAEIKSRLQKFQVQTIAMNKMPMDFLLQVQSQLFVSERKFCEFISYSNGMCLYVEEQYPIPKYQDAIGEALIGFEASVARVVEAYGNNSSNLVLAERQAEFIDGEIK